MKKRSLLILAFLLILTFARAAYFERLPYIITQPDKTTFSCFVSGDEFFNWIHDSEGYTIIQAPDGYYYYAEQNGDLLKPSDYLVNIVNPANVGLSKWAKISKKEYQRRYDARFSFEKTSNNGPVYAPHSGTLNNLVVYIRFSDDTELTTTRQVYDNKFNPATGVSLKSYYKEVSYNNFTISSTHYPACALNTNLSYQDPHPRNYYKPYNATTNPTGYTDNNDARNREHTLLSSAINWININSPVPASLNLDGDGDNNVDNVCFIIKGNSGAWSDLLWAHRWSLYTQNVYINSKKVYDYTFQPESQVDVQTLCHEMFHALGSPDLYHYNDGGLNISPVGNWDLMESGGGHMTAYMKWKYTNHSWISTIPEITASGTYTLNPLTSSTNNCYKIASPNSTSEYFMVEYRNKTGTFETNIPGSGLIVYRIDINENGNAYGPPDEVYIYRPNGTTTSDGTLNSAYFSSTVGRTAINDATNPSSFLQNGSAGGLNISNVTTAGATISFNVTFINSCITPTVQATAFTSSALANNSMTTGWTRGNGTSVLVVARQGSAVNTNPINGTTYTANAAFGSGTQIGSGNYVVYKGTGNSVNLSSLTSGTTYYYAIYEFNSTGYCYKEPALTGNASTTGTPPCNYCASSGTIDYNTSITLVNFNTINNVTAKPAAYNNYTTLMTTVIKSSTYNLIVNLNTDGAYTIHANAWIDWNKDCDFNDAGETYDLGTSTNVTNGATTLSPLNITIPATAITGNTRMRVAAKYDADPTSCETGFDGEVEDYTINITASTCTPPTNQATTFTSSALANNSMTIGWTRGNGNSVIVIAKQGSIVNTNPVNGTTYTASAAFGSGTQIGTGNYVIYNGTGTSVNLTALTSGTAYFYAVYEYNATGNCFKTPALTGNASTTGIIPYCTAGSTAIDYEYISNVAIGSINQASARGNAGYQDFTSQITSMQTGVNASATISITNPYTTDQILIWIDWNKDGDFADAGENVYTSSGTFTNPHTTTNFAPPVGASIGTTRMRIRLHDLNSGANSTSCGNSDYGEVEDYTINVTSGSTQTLTVSPLTQNVTFGTGSTTFTITSTVAWNANSNQSWCTVTPSGSGNGILTASFTANSSPTSRTAMITVSGTGVNPVMVNVIQSGTGSIVWPQSFEGTVFPPTGWTKQSPDGGTGWRIDTVGTALNGWTSGTIDAPAGGGNQIASVTWIDGGATYNDAWLITPQMTPTTGDFFTFYLKNFTPTFVDAVDIMVSTTTNAIGSFTTNLLPISTFTGQWTKYDINLAPYVGQPIYIAFREHVADNATNGGSIGLDLVKKGVMLNNDMQVYSIAIPPGVVFTGNVTLKAFLKNNGTQPQTAGKVVTFYNGTSVLGTATTTAPILSGAIDSVSFTWTNVAVGSFVVKAEVVADDDNSNNFATANLTVYSPSSILSESFEGTTFPPIGWTVINGGDANTWLRSTLRFHTGTACAGIFYSTAAHADYLITPKLAIATGSNTLTVWVRSTGNYYPEPFDVMVSTTGNAAANFTLLVAEPNPDSLWIQKTYNLSAYNGQNIYVAFRSTTTDMDVLFIDDVVGPPIYTNPGATITFNVSNGTSPIVGANININGNNFTTNASGNASAFLGAGSYPYTVSAFGYANGTGNITVVNGVNQTIPVTLTSATNTYTATFTVRNNMLAPLAGATIILTQGSTILNGTTNAAGVYAFNLPAATYNYSVSLNNYFTQTGTLTIIAANVPVLITLINLPAPLYNNGPLITNAGAGPGGADMSLIQAPNTSWGVNHSKSAFIRVADDFSFTANSWAIDSIVFFAYQTGSTTTSTFTAYNLRIWNGVPGAIGSTVVWGDTNTNRMTNSYWSGIYRGSDLTGTTRPIMRNICNTSPLTLTGGNYWIDWQAEGSLTSGPWVPAIAIVGQPITGNAMQANYNVWANILDGTNNQGLPFIIYGTAIIICNPAAITAQPAATQTLCSPSANNVSFTVAANTGTAPISYQWQYNNGGTWTNVSNGIPTGAIYTNGTASTMSVNGITNATTYQYRCYVTNCNGANNATSDIASLVVNASPILNPITPQTICSGENTTLVIPTSNPSGAGFTWTATATTGISGYTISGTTTIPVQTINTTANSAGTVTYTITPTLNSCIGSTSTFVVNVNPKPFVANQTTTITTGTSFSVIPTGVPTGTTYTWNAPTYTGGVSGGSAQLTGSTTISQILTIPAGSGTATYTVTPTSGNCTGNTFTVTVTVNFNCTPVNITTQPTASQTSCYPLSGILFTVTATGASPIIYQWQFYNGGNWTNVTNGIPAGAIYNNETTETISVNGITNAATYQYRCYVTNCNGANSATSNTATLIIISPPSAAGNITGTTTVCRGESNINYTIPGIANATSYIWTLPTGANGTSTTNSITVSYGTNAVSGNIAVQGSNTCGNGNMSLLAITVNPIPVTPIITKTGNILTSNAPTGNQWYNLSTGLLPGANANTYNPLQIGNYFTIVTLNSCKSDSSNIIYYDNTGIAENNTDLFNVRISPNPFTGKTNILYTLSESANVTLSIFDITGKEILKLVDEKQSKGEQNILFLANYSSGLYFYKLLINDKICVGKLLLDN